MTSLDASRPDASRPPARRAPHAGAPSAPIVVSRIRELPCDQWDLCAGASNPFVHHAHLEALEESGSLRAEIGYQPLHTVLLDPDGRIAAVAPAYLKANSEAEIGADMGLAIAHARVAGSYYPKLQVEVALTPTIGPRLLVRPDLDLRRWRTALLEALLQVATDRELSSVHLNGLTTEERDCAVDAGLLAGRYTRFQWQNPGHTEFDQFISGLKKGRRNDIRRERRRVRQHGLRFEQISATAVDARLLAQFHELYADTYRRYDHPCFLTASYFERIFDALGSDALLFCAFSGDELVGATLHIVAGDMLIAQHWGCAERIPFLHFELTYYQGMEHVIASGLRVFDVGPVGGHKAIRGFRPSDTWHAHWFRSSEFQAIAAHGFARLDAALMEERTRLLARLPYRTRSAT